MPTPAARRPPLTILAGLLALVALVAGLSACTKSSPTKTVESTQVITTPPSTGPVPIGTVTSKSASTCPLIATQTAADQAGMRLDKITVLSAGGKVVGCRIYPLEHPNEQCDQSCLSAEDLPPGNQPAVQIDATPYASSTAAFNAVVHLAEAGTNPQQDTIVKGVTGACFQTEFWSKDAGKDWACAFNKGVTVVLIKTVVTDPALNVVEIAQAVYPKV